MFHVALQIGRQNARGRRADQGFRVGCRIDLGDNAALEIDAFRHAFLDPVGACDRLRKRCGIGEPALGRQRRHGQHFIGALGIGEHLANDALGLRMRIEDRRVDAGQHETRRPGSPDHPAADTGCLLNSAHHVLVRMSVCRVTRPRNYPGRAGHQRLVSLSFFRTSSGPMIRAPMPSITVTAFSTSWALVASRPLPA
jgi:hypothetical protein